jgi:hypothetical protein
MTELRKEAPMHNSTSKTVAASLAALAVIVSLGTSPVLARGGGGHGGGFGAGGGIHVGGGGGAFHGGGGFHPGGQMYSGYHGHNHFYGGYNACAVNPFNQLVNPTYPYSC